MGNSAYAELDADWSAEHRMASSSQAVVSGKLRRKQAKGVSMGSVLHSILLLYCGVYLLVFFF